MRKFAIAVVTVAAFATLVACGDGDTSSAPTESSAPSADNGVDDMDMDDGDHGSFAFGEHADAADADRTIEVDMFDDFRYEPDSIDVTVGETVAFRVHNSGKVAHEFVIGDKALQEEHEQEMQEMEGGMMMGDEPNAIGVEPGGTKTIAFHFTEAAELEYACHQPAHYAAGMLSPLTVS